MIQAGQVRSARRAKLRDATRAGIMSAARRVAEREGAGRLSLRNVAAEAGFAPAALYVYFSNKSELVLALAADDLANITRAMRVAVAQESGARGSRTAVSVAFALLSKTETLAAAATAMDSRTQSGALRVFNGRLIAALSALSAALVQPFAKNREGQAEVLLVAAALTGLAILTRSGRLEALGFDPDEVLARLPRLAEGER